MARLVLIILFVVRAASAMSETKTAIRPSELNPKILDDIHRNYASYLIVEAFKVNNRGAFTYEAIIQNNTGKINLYYTTDGVFIRKELPLQQNGKPKRVSIKRSFNH